MEKKKITLKDLPQDVVNEFKKELLKNEKYRELSNLRQAYIRTGNYMKAMQLFETMNKIEDIFAEQYASMYTREVRKIDELIASMSEEDQTVMHTYGNMLTMLADMLDTAVMDANQLLDKYHPDYHIEMFDKLKALGAEAKSFLRMLDNSNPDQFYLNLFGDTVDKLYEMSFNKARSFVTKLRKHEESVSKKAARNAKVA